MESRFIDFRQHRNFMNTISAIFEFMGAALRPYFKAVTYIAGPYILVAAVASGVYTVRSLDASVFDFQLFEVGELFLPLLILYAALLVASMMTMATTYSFLRISQRESDYPDVNAVRADMRGMLGRVLGTSLLAMVVLLPALMLFVIPGIWISIPLSLMVVIRYYEDLTFSEALKRAIRLVRDHWWWTFGILFLCYLAYMLTASIFSIPSMILLMFSTMTAIEGTEPSSTLQIVTGVLSALGNLVGYFFMSILSVATAAIYYNHVERIDATQLSDRVAHLAGSTQD